jgi:hypothetical protein
MNLNIIKDNKAEGLLSKIFEVFMLLILIILLLLLCYMLYYNLPGSPEEVDFIFDNSSKMDNLPVSEAKQFYPNMKFNHNNISYYIETSCNPEKRQKMIAAFDKVSDEINFIRFYEVYENPDIEILCSEEKKESIDSEHFIAGEGGPKEILQTGRYNVIILGTILLYGESKDLLKCDWPNVELHELMHVLGFNHTNNKKSLMYPYLDSCDKKIDNSIITELNRLYSEENLPELYFENIKLIKRGRYLDFNLTIKNSGLIDAENVYLNVYDENKLVEINKIGDIKFGAGIYLEIKNLKLFNRDSKDITFVIDKNNTIKEFDKENNLAKIQFND